MPIRELPQKRRVYPSGAAFATISAPIVPPALGRLSMITDWPQLSLSFCPNSLPTMSMLLPAPMAMTILTGRTGNCCACEALDDVNKATTISFKAIRFMALLRLFRANEIATCGSTCS